MAGSRDPEDLQLEYDDGRHLLPQSLLKELGMFSLEDVDESHSTQNTPENELRQSSRPRKRTPQERLQDHIAAVRARNEREPLYQNTKEDELDLRLSTHKGLPKVSRRRSSQKKLTGSSLSAWLTSERPRGTERNPTGDSPSSQKYRDFEALWDRTRVLRHPAATRMPTISAKEAATPSPLDSHTAPTVRTGTFNGLAEVNFAESAFSGGQPSTKEAEIIGQWSGVVTLQQPAASRQPSHTHGIRDPKPQPQAFVKNSEGIAQTGLDRGMLPRTANEAMAACENGERANFKFKSFIKPKPQRRKAELRLLEDSEPNLKDTSIPPYPDHNLVLEQTPLWGYFGSPEDLELCDRLNRNDASEGDLPEDMECD